MAHLGFLAQLGLEMSPDNFAIKKIKIVCGGSSFVVIS